jgi:hypothetical protein
MKGTQMRQKTKDTWDGAEKAVRDVRCKTRKQYSAEKNITNVAGIEFDLDGTLGSTAILN